MESRSGGLFTGGGVEDGVSDESDILDEVVDESGRWYPHECTSCGHWWMGGADFLRCPECGSQFIGVGGIPEGVLAVGGEEPA